ncbi:hypothetical protein QVN82_03985 [Yersinia enterocolitica]|uniref:hypothetical protein n=1 Tax=Yersinia enterocolitica TaxID=630 RepID=UPI0025AB0C03|nr:hypothetical protein [Yersinia enterocolitica]MDN0097791.1 hypothetical protein [Yersinia enterocolitica]HEI6727804.1 hypothetical protein [Yersinia enterocolitica]HEI6740093.1 hypothetical protein [Yersinia enterocolitica]HEI6925204.1 hypothetical protein [Yersinia enterocolitica]
MKKIRVSISKLNGSVDFEVFQNGKLLFKDTISGKCTNEYVKIYDVECSSEPLTINHSGNIETKNIKACVVS